MSNIDKELLNYLESVSTDEFVSVLSKTFWSPVYRKRFLDQVRSELHFDDSILNVIFSYTELRKGENIKIKDIISLGNFLKRNDVKSASQAILVIRNANMKRKK